MLDFKKRNALVEAVAAAIKAAAEKATELGMEGISPLRLTSHWVVHRGRVRYPSDSDAEYVFNLAVLGIYEALSKVSSSRWLEALADGGHNEVRRAAAEVADARIRPLLEALEEAIWLYRNLRPTTLKTKYVQPYYIYAQAARDAFSRRYDFHRLAAVFHEWHKDHRFAYAMEVGASVTAWDKSNHFWAVLRRKSGEWPWHLTLEKQGEDGWEVEHPYYILPGKVREKSMELKLFYHAHPELGERISVVVVVDGGRRAFATAYERKVGGSWRWQPWRRASGWEDVRHLLIAQEAGLDSAEPYQLLGLRHVARQGDIFYYLDKTGPGRSQTTLPEGLTWERGFEDGRFGTIVATAPVKAGQVLVLEHPDHPAVRIRVPEDRDMVLVAEQIPGETDYAGDEGGWE